MRIKKINEARHSFLYRYCMNEWWPALDAHAEVYQYRKGEMILKEGDPVNGIYFMLNGVAKVHKLWDQEKELILRFAHQQDILGHRGLSSAASPYPITATALTSVTSLYISLDFFEATFKTNQNFAYRFMMFMADELMLSEIRMRNLAHMNVRARLAQALLALENKFGTNEAGFIAFTTSRQDIAAYVGTAYETVYKSINEFIELGYIKTEAKAIALIDKTALKKAVC